MKRLIVLALVALFPILSYAQLSTNFEGIQYRTADERQGVGATLQLDLPIDGKFRPGIKAGMLYDINNPAGVNSFQVPVMGVARYYLIGSHGCWGGVYAEGGAGIGLYHERVTDEGFESNTRTMAKQASIGFGWRLPILLDVGIQWGQTFGEVETLRYTGVRASLRF